MGADIYSRQHTLATAGGPLNVYESGEADRPAILLLHGAMYDEARLSWYHLAPKLAQTRRVFALDFPRHGRSRPWTVAVGQDRLIQVAEEVISHFRLAPLPLIGLSMGGGVAIGYALKHPEQVTGAVLMAPGGLGDRVRNQFLSWALVKTPGLMKMTARYFAGLSEDKMRRSMASLLHDGENTRGFDGYVRLITEEARAKRAHREKAFDDWQAENLAPFRLRLNFLPELPRLTCPTLWLRGENDPLVGQGVMEQAARLAPNGKLTVIQNAGHLLPLEQPDEVGRAVLDFLSFNRI